MNKEIEQLLYEQGASMVGFADIEGAYNEIDIKGPRAEDSEEELKPFPMYSRAVSIIVALPKDKCIEVCPYTKRYINS